MSESAKKTVVIKGRDEMGQRISSKAFEEMVQAASSYADHLILETYGQHNVGGRIQKKDGHITIQVKGPSGQRLGCMARPGSTIICEGQTSNDLGYLNIGADIIVKGDAGDGACNAMAQGRVMVGGSIGARGLTMTKWNPAFTRPELWVLGSVGDIFAEFNCGGIGVVCGVNAKTPDNVLGYRPCVGMVGGMIYYRGRTDGSFSKGDVKEAALDDEKWRWLLDRIPGFLSSIGRSELLDMLSVRSEWKALIPLTPQEKTLRSGSAISMAEFKAKVWDAAFKGDPLKDLAPELDRTPVGLIVTGDLRRRRPYWANRESAAPCTFYCPTHIPTVDRLRLIREGRIDEAYRLTLRHTPFPASVCGAICPNLCMEQCSRQAVDGESIDIAMLGRAVIDAVLPDSEPSRGRKVAIIGGGPAGMSAAWQLAQAGIDAHIFEKETRLGGKMDQVIPWDRLPLAIWQHELDRFMKMPNIHLHLGVSVTKESFQGLLDEYEYVIVAAGAHEPRRIPFPGSERVITALDFLKSVKSGSPMQIGRRVVIIGAGNVGCDVACEAYRNGAGQVTLVDIQKPLAFGKEREAAEALGAVFRWPVMTREVTEEGLVLADGEIIPADTVMISIGDVPALGFLPETIELFRGWIKTDETGRTSDPRIFAIGDVEKPGLITHALGAGKRTAEFIVAAITGKDWEPFKKKVIDRRGLTTAHYYPSGRSENQIDEAQRCLSCGSCRDCHLCETICPERAISRKDMEDGGYEYVSDDDKCIACGFCADTCPCGIWVMRAF
jgi:NADPH-dependent glutamate synthase beta subunit-like oxidoreductase/glutamate synthase domain-containing protein 3